MKSKEAGKKTARLPVRGGLTRKEMQQAAREAVSEIPTTSGPSKAYTENWDSVFNTDNSKHKEQ